MIIISSAMVLFHIGVIALLVLTQNQFFGVKVGRVQPAP